jgi:hypothetical protein
MALHRNPKAAEQVLLLTIRFISVPDMSKLVRRLTQIKLIRRFMRHPRAKSAPDVWRLGLDSRNVILERTSRAIRGKLSAAEARRMVLEKQSAAVPAQLAYTQALLQGDPALASRAFFDVYHRAVQSNRKRLCKTRWHWPGRNK